MKFTATSSSTGGCSAAAKSPTSSGSGIPRPSDSRLHSAVLEHVTPGTISRCSVSPGGAVYVGGVSVRDDQGPEEDGAVEAAGGGAAGPAAARERTGAGKRGNAPGSGLPQ